MLHHDRWNQGTKKQTHFGISLEFTLVAKWNARFIKKKKTQLKSDIRSYKCKNFKLKQAPGLIGRVCTPGPSPLILHYGNDCSWRHDGQAHPPHDFYRSDSRVHHPLDAAIMLQLRPRHWPNLKVAGTWYKIGLRHFPDLPEYCCAWIEVR